MPRGEIENDAEGLKEETARVGELGESAELISCGRRSRNRLERVA